MNEKICIKNLDKLNENLDAIIELDECIYQVKSWPIIKLLDMHVVLDYSYFKKLKLYRNPYFAFDSFQIFCLLVSDYYNRVMFGTNGCLKMICKYDENFNIIGTFDSLYEAISDDTKAFKYGFTKYDSNEIYKQYYETNFFGYKVHIFDKLDIKILNNSIEYYMSWINGVRGKRKFDEEKKHNKNFNYMFFEEYKNNYYRWQCFSLGSILYNKNLKIIKNINPNKVKFNNFINDIQNRYFYEGKTLIENVDNLKKYEKLSGIYILQISKYQKFYIGQAKTLSKRIIDHIKNSTTTFDGLVTAKDINKIFILEAPEVTLDCLEQDLIAFAGKDILMNVLVGGDTIFSIDDSNYDKKDFLLTPFKLKKIIKLLSEYKMCK